MNTNSRHPTAPAMLIAGGNPNTRERLGDWVSHEFPGHPVLIAADTADLRGLGAAERPGVALVDIDGPGLGGLELLRALHTIFPGAAPVALSSYHADSYRDYAIGAGAVACVSPQMLNGALKDLIAQLLRAAAPRSVP